MNMSKAFANFPTARSSKASAAFTLPEVLVSVTIFLFLVTGIIGATLFGMRSFQISQSKLLETQSTREAIGKLTDEVRSCESVYVGSVSTNGVFSGCTNGAFQISSGLLIYPTTNTTNFIIYFLNRQDQTFRRECSASGLTTIVANTVTNSDIFQAQDYLGNVLTNNQDIRVIRCTLQFYQAVANGSLPTSYTLDTAVSKRAL